jgi:hypothetical protein
MKTTTLSVLVFYTSLMGFLNINNVEKNTNQTSSSYSSPDKEKVTASFHYSANPINLSDSTIPLVKRKYRIFFENRSPTKIDVTIRYENEEGQWVINEPKNLNPGEEHEMGITHSKTYFYHASSKKRLNKKALTSKFMTGLHEAAMVRLGFTKQDIWECYNTDTCNSFAVFE